MINIADQLHAATADGVLANASEIKDGTKMQSQINAEVTQAILQSVQLAQEAYELACAAL